jgi:hypothetical protein
MRKLLLLLFLFTLTSNALAKVEIWECDLFDRGDFDSIHKIDTSLPMVYVRRDGIWNAYYQKTPSYIIEYSEEEDSIWWRNKDGKIFEVFDLVLKQTLYINTKTGDTDLIIPCRVRE